MYIEYGEDNKKFYIVDELELNKSSKTVEYGNITVDFTNATINDLPFYLQEIRIKEDNGKLIYTGYLSDYTLPELRIKDVKREIELSLFTPRELATKRTITIVKNGKLTDIIKQVLAPLFQDGFTMKEINLTEKNINIKVISRTVEEIMNYLSNKYSLFWNINEYKEITVNSIEYQLDLKDKYKLNSKNCWKQIKGLISITPNVENSDYANIINVKNARIFYRGGENNLNVTMKNGDRYEFENPIDISLLAAERIEKNLIAQGSSTTINNISIIYDDYKEAYIISGFNVSGDLQNGTNVKDIGTKDSSGAKFILSMDQTFKNMATGFTYKGQNNIVLREYFSDTMLRYSSMKLINWYEINKNAGKITPSGQIEKVLDANGGWFTTEELIDYVRNTFINNSKETKVIKFKTDKYNDIIIGDKIYFDIPECFVKGSFIVTEIRENYEDNYEQYTYTLMNTSLPENYIDLFRSSLDLEENDSQTDIEYVVEYSEEETIEEIHEMKFDKYDTEHHVLNFELKG